MTGIIALALSVLGTQRVYAQSLSDQDITVSEFSSLDISDEFEVTLSRGAYGVHLTIDENLAPYVEVYVRSKTLFITYDEKSVPKEIKKLYKGKDALEAVSRVVVYAPEIQTITLSDNVTLNCLEEFTSSRFELNATGKTQVRNLSVTATTARINLKKNAQAMVNVKADRSVEVSTENSSNLKLTASGNELVIDSDGSSVVVADGTCRSLNVASSGSSQVTVTAPDTDKVSLTPEGSSKVVLSGKAKELKVKGARSSSVDAYAMPFEEVEANLSGSCSVTVSVSKKVDVTLVGGSALYFSGTPEFRINKIVKSTLAPYGTK